MAANILRIAGMYSFLEELYSVTGGEKLVFHCLYFFEIFLWEMPQKSYWQGVDFMAEISKSNNV